MGPVRIAADFRTDQAAAHRCVPPRQPPRPAAVSARPGPTRPAIFWTRSSPGHARACRPSGKGSNWRFRRARSSEVHCSIAISSAILRLSARSFEAFPAISRNRSPAMYPSACGQRNFDYARRIAPIYPYCLACHRSPLYLAGWSPDHEEIRHWKNRPDRQVAPGGVPLPLPRGFQSPRPSGQVVWRLPWRGGEVSVQLRFAPRVARYVQESNWHDG